MVTVSTDEICAAIKDAFEDTSSILEPAGALAIAGLKADVAGRNFYHQIRIDLKLHWEKYLTRRHRSALPKKTAQPPLTAGFGIRVFKC